MGWDIYVKLVGICSISSILNSYKVLLKSQIVDESKLKFLLSYYSKLDRDVFFKDMIINLNLEQLYIEQCNYQDLFSEEILNKIPKEEWISEMKSMNIYVEYISILYLIEELEKQNIEKYLKVFINNDLKLIDGGQVEILIYEWSSYKASEDLDIDYRATAVIIDEWKDIITDIQIKTNVIVG